MVERRPIPSFPGYMATADGDIISKQGTPMFQKMHPDGYPFLYVWRDGKKVCKPVHQLVAEAFHGPRPSPKHEVAHWDGVRNNNTAINLRWATHAENRADMERHGTVCRGERSALAKLTEKDVVQIRAARAAGETRANLAAQYGVDYFCIAKVDTYRRWKHVP